MLRTDRRPGALPVKRGKYVLLCNLLGQYKAGQRAALRVR